MDLQTRNQLQRDYARKKAEYDRDATARALSRAASGGGATDEPMELLGQALDQRRRRLQAIAQPSPASAPFVADDPVCRRCGGSGYVRLDLPPRHPQFGRAQPCDLCFQRVNRARLASAWPVSKRDLAFGRTPFEDRQGAFPAVIRAWEVQEAFLDGLPDGRLMALVGPAGTGKSHLALVVYHAAMEAGLSAICVTGELFQARLQRFGHGSAESKQEAEQLREDNYRDLVSVDLLVLDEADKLNGGWIQNKLLAILDERLRLGRATLLAFNYLDRMHPLILSRCRAWQPWPPEDDSGQRSGWVDLSSVADARPIYGLDPRPVNS